ncbi:MAG: hypothetical protein Q7U47_15990 [Paludibacter sp.]|nr:hypothetical protein [Paludibacter sp.]
MTRILKRVYFALMYFKVSGRQNPHTGKPDWYYRLVESYRNSDGRVCHRTMLNIGYLEGLTTDHKNLTQKILTQRSLQVQNLLFEIPVSEDSIVNRYVETYYNRLVAEKRIDVLQEDKPKKKPYAKGKDLEIIDLNSIRNKDVREIGAEWLSYQATEQLQIRSFLEGEGWSDSDIRLAQTDIISRAVYPASEAESSRWIKENSAVCEVTGYDNEKSKGKGKGKKKDKNEVETQDGKTVETEKKQIVTSGLFRRAFVAMLQYNT